MKETLLKEYDSVVVGGGPIGLATAYNLAKSGKKVLVLEKSVFFNGGGSSGDIIRMFRTMYTEDFMADLAKESIQIWKELGDDAGEGDLIWMSGLLNFGDPKYGAGGPEGTLEGPIPNMIRLGMPYRLLTSEQIMEEYPFKNLPPTDKGIFSPDCGCINLPLLLRALYKLCLEYGCKMVSNAEVTKINNISTTKVEVLFTHTDVNKKTTENISVLSSKAAITSNAFVNHVLAPSYGFELDMTIWEMTSSYFVSKPGPNGTVFKNMWFQFRDDTNNDPTKSNLFYGFPAVPWGIDNHCRISVDAATRQIKDPNDRQDGVDVHDVNLTRDWVREHLPGMDDTPLFNCSTLMANVYDNMFVLDFVPGSNNNVVLFACGWAMKFTPLIGKILCQLLVDGKTEYNIEHFSIHRGDGVLMREIDSPAQYRIRPANGSSMHCGQKHLMQVPMDAAESNNVKRPNLRAMFASKLLQRSLSHENKFQSMINKRKTKIITRGSEKSINVGIIGSGMAGLYAAMICEDLGLQYTILEANKDRLGGRIYTYRFPQNQDKRQYVDIGAMRFPKIEIMDRLLSDESWSLFSKLKQKGFTVPVLPYHLSVANNLVYYNGQRIYADNKLIGDPLHFSNTHNGGEGAVPDEYANVPYGDLLDKVYKKFADDLANDFDGGFQRLLEADCNSTRAYLVKNGPFPQSVVNYLETMDSGSGLYDMAFSESIMDSFDFSGSEWCCIEGGSDFLIKSMIKTLRPNCIQKGKLVTKITKSKSKKGEVNGLDIHCADTKEISTFKHVISTATLSALRRVDLKELELSHNARLAIRTLHYDHSVKISLAFKSRWWEDSVFMKGKPMLGGKSSTDLPIRTIVYPSYGIGEKDISGVLIVSYTWAQDASRIGSLVGDVTSEKYLVQMCMKQLAEVHDVSLESLEKLYVDYYAFDWYNDDYASGAFALYSPAQFSQLFPSVTKPAGEGRFHMAGEATSVHHGWIIGSLNSAYRAVDHVLQMEGMELARAKLRANWGTIDEVEDPELDDDNYVDKSHSLGGPNAKKFRSAVSTVSVAPRFKVPQGFFQKRANVSNVAGTIGGFK